jgi:hypothetical protein
MGRTAAHTDGSESDEIADASAIAAYRAADYTAGTAGLFTAFVRRGTNILRKFVAPRRTATDAARKRQRSIAAADAVERQCEARVTDARLRYDHHTHGDEQQWRRNGRREIYKWKWQHDDER